MLYDQARVDAELDKPYNLEKEVKLFLCQSLTGNEEEKFFSLKDRWVIARELERLTRQALRQPAFSSHDRTKNFYMTAGGPGSGKTTFVRHAQNNGAFSGATHVDPDDLLKAFRPYQRLLDV